MLPVVVEPVVAVESGSCEDGRCAGLVPSTGGDSESVAFGSQLKPRFAEANVTLHHGVIYNALRPRHPPLHLYPHTPTQPSSLVVVVVDNIIHNGGEHIVDSLFSSRVAALTPFQVKVGING